jgi:hypothetical protein
MSEKISDIKSAELLPMNQAKELMAKKLNNRVAFHITEINKAISEHYQFPVQYSFRGAKLLLMSC